MSRSAVLSLLLAAVSAIAVGQIRGVPPPAEVASQIEAALHDDPALAKNPIVVSVDETQIVLNGTVANRMQKRTAGRIAASFAVNRKMVDKLVVRSENPPGQVSR